MVKMFYSPHILYVKRHEMTRDEYGRIESDIFYLEKIGECRCDDDNTQELETDNGKVYKSTYHIVCGKTNLKNGDEVVVKQGSKTRGKGVIGRIRSTNYYDYTEIWV